MRSQHPTDVLERENEALRRFLDEKEQKMNSKVSRFEALLDLLAVMTDHDTTSWAIRLVGQDIRSWGDFEDAVENRAIQMRAALEPPYPTAPYEEA